MADKPSSIGLIGFGEAGQAFTKGWRKVSPHLEISTFDIKVTGPEADAKREDFRKASVDGQEDIGGLAGRHLFSLVTADQARIASTSAAPHVGEDAFFFDANSCAPQTKSASAEIIEATGGRYVDVAIMSPVHPKLHRSPLLISGPHAEEAALFLQSLDMDATIVPGEVGMASSIKMVRSIMMKGLEAVMLECVLAGRATGVDERVLDSLDVTYPDFDFRKQAARMMERATTHGVRRAAEMREVAKTVEMLGLPSSMSSATVHWMDKAAASGVRVTDSASDYKEIGDRLLEAVREDDI